MRGWEESGIGSQGGIPDCASPASTRNALRTFPVDRDHWISSPFAAAKATDVSVHYGDTYRPAVVPAHAPCVYSFPWILSGVSHASSWIYAH